MGTYRIRVILFSLKQRWVLGIQFRTGHQNQAKSSLEQGQVSGGPAAHPTKISVQYPLPPSQSGLRLTNLSEHSRTSSVLRRRANARNVS